MDDDDRIETEEHELPSLEAVLACTLALMTGYSQALQAELHPGRRLVMGEKVTEHLAALTGHPLLSPGFRTVAADLQQRWRAMSACTRDAASACDAGSRQGRSPDDGGFFGRPASKQLR